MLAFFPRCLRSLIKVFRACSNFFNNSTRRHKWNLLHQRRQSSRTHRRSLPPPPFL